MVCHSLMGYRDVSVLIYVAAVLATTDSVDITAAIG